MEPLPQASEGDEGLSGEAAGCHLAVGLLELPRRTLAHETAREPVDALAAVLAHAGYAAARRGVQLTVLACKGRKKHQFYALCWLFCVFVSGVSSLYTVSRLVNRRMINYLSSHHLIDLSSFYLFRRACCPPLTEIQTVRIIRLESSCFSNMPLIISHAHLYTSLGVMLLRPLIKQQFKEKPTSV